MPCPATVAGAIHRAPTPLATASSDPGHPAHPLFSYPRRPHGDQSPRYCTAPDESGFVADPDVLVKTDNPPLVSGEGREGAARHGEFRPGPAISSPQRRGGPERDKNNAPRLRVSAVNKTS